jgi:hypothetical protein
MAPQDKGPSANDQTEAPSLAELNTPEALAAATEQLRALGIDDEVVFACTNVEDLAARMAARRAERVE